MPTFRRMLRDSTALTMHSNRPVPIESRALVTLSYIRTSIDAAGSLAVPGMAGIVMGSIGMGAAALASLPSFSRHWLVIWMTAAFVAFLLGGALMARQAAHARGGTLLSAPFRKFLLCLSPPLFAGAVFTFVLSQAGLQWLIPGAWLLLYGCAVICASTVTSARNLPLIASMGGLFVLLGSVTFALPASAHTPALGAGFGVVHLVFGILIGRANRGE